MRLQTIKESVTKLDKPIYVLDLFKEYNLEDKDLNLKYNTFLVMEAANYLSGHLLGETPQEAFQLPTVAALIYATEVLKSEKMFNEYQNLDNDFTYVNDGNILNLLTLTNCMNIYHFNIKKPLCRKLTLPMINDVYTLAKRIVLYSKVHDFERNVYAFNGCYTNNINRGHKVSVCKDRLFTVDMLSDNPNNKCLEIIAYYILLKKHKDLNALPNIKELVVFDPFINKELIVNVNDLTNELIEQIIEKVL